MSLALSTHSPETGFYRTDKTVIGCSGFHGDCLTLTKIIEARLKVGAFEHVALLQQFTAQLHLERQQVSRCS
jgi:hypothetical protein